MTRKHFEALAGALYRAQQPGSHDVRRQWHAVLVTVSNACAESNRRFDVGRFEHHALYGHNPRKGCC